MAKRRTRANPLRKGLLNKKEGAFLKLHFKEIKNKVTEHTNAIHSALEKTRKIVKAMNGCGL